MFKLKGMTEIESAIELILGVIMILIVSLVGWCIIETLLWMVGL